MEEPAPRTWRDRLNSLVRILWVANPGDLKGETREAKAEESKTNDTPKA